MLMEFVGQNYILILKKYYINTLNIYMIHTFYTEGGNNKKKAACSVQTAF